MYTKAFFVAGLLSLVSAQSYTPPTTQTWGSLLTPDVSHPVTRGETFKVTWDSTGHATSGVTVSLVLCRGPSSNCVTDPTAIVSGLPAAQNDYEWAVPCSLAPGVQSTETGYGMLIIVDGTGEFQYSTQFSVLAGTTCGGASNSTTSSSTSSLSSSSSATTSTTTESSTAATTSTTTMATSHTTAQQNYTHTTVKPTAPTTIWTATTISASTAGSPTPSQFHGVATRVGGSAAALLVAAGAAFFAL